MSITDELRRYVASMCGYPHSAKCSGYKRLLEIADRIDAEHERVRDGVYADKMDANGWIRLPKDADGVPIKVGDKVECGGNAIEVIGFGNVTSDDDGYGVFTQGKDGCYEWYNARFCRHHQPDSWERIIEDALSESGWVQPKEYETDFEDSKETRDRFVAELVERCRRLAGE